MRLQAAFLVLLLVATIALGLELREYPLAREGDVLARVLVFTAGPVLFVSVLLLLRILSRVEDLRRKQNEVSR